MGGRVPEYKFDECFVKEFQDSEIKEAKIHSFTEDAKKLLTEHKPRISNKKKKWIFEQMMKKNIEFEGKVSFSRFMEMNLIENFSKIDSSFSKKFIIEKGGFDYVNKNDGKDGLDWWLNFADEHLFGAYGGSLLAQDEMQVMEMPVLGSIREKLLDDTVNDDNPFLQPMTRLNDYASPVLIKNVQRRLYIKLDKNPQEGRPFGLYGNAFNNSPDEAIEKALVLLDKDQINLYNIVAMEAPKGGSGEYDLNTILFTFKTCFTAFKACVFESESKKVTIHSGAWGTGAYGGDGVLLGLCQIAAAHLANVDQLVFHSFTEKNFNNFAAALKIFTEYMEKGNLSTKDFVEFLLKKKFKWGVGDGN